MLQGTDALAQDETLVAVLAPQGRDAAIVVEALHHAGVSAVALSEAEFSAQVFSAHIAPATVVLTAEALSPSLIAALNALIRDQESWSDLPVVLIAGKSSAELSLKRLFDQRANLTLMERPMNVATLLSVVQAALRARSRQLEVRDLLRQRAELNEQLRRHGAELEHANRELESFSYSVSHDLRAPLRSILGFSAALLEEHSQELSDEAAHYLGRVQANAEKMSELIDTLLRLARITQSPLRLRYLDLAALARQVARSLQEQQPERVVAFEALECPPAYADEKLLGVALDNLLSNAWKFTSCMNAPRVGVGFELRGGECVYYVRDNGAGFDMNHAKQLFGTFQRLHRAEDFGGLGIGLATVQRVIHRHGGRVWAEAKPNEGATFYFTLPTPEGVEGPGFEGFASLSRGEDDEDPQGRSDGMGQGSG